MSEETSKWRITHECADRYRQRFLNSINSQEPVRWRIGKALDRSVLFDPPPKYVARAIINNNFNIAEYRYDPKEEMVYVTRNGTDIVTCYRFDPECHGKRPIIQGDSCYSE